MMTKKKEACQYAKTCGNAGGVYCNENCPLLNRCGACESWRPDGLELGQCRKHHVFMLEHEGCPDFKKLRRVA